MTLSRRIYALQTAAIAFGLAMLAILAIGLHSAGESMRGADLAQSRLNALAELRSDLSAYRAAVTRVLLLGLEQVDEVRNQRIEIEMTLVRLTQATRAEIAALTDRAAIETQMPKLEESRRLVELYHSIDASTNRAFSTLRGNERTTAIGIFEKEVTFRLANETTPLLEDAIARERTLLGDNLAAAERLTPPLLIAGVVIAVLASAGLFVLGRGVRLTAEADRRKEGEANTQQLRDANERLRSIDNLRAQFLADVSHQLRTPLTILRGEADVALRGSEDRDGLRQTLERIQGQARELGDLLEELLAFARYEGESQDLEFADGRLDDIVAAAAQEAAILAEPREVTIETQPNDVGSHLEADFRRLKQALLIGLDNAVKHSAPGETVRIATARDLNEVVVSILDNGPGVPPDEAAHVFERFFRGRAEDEMQLSGLGIGLSIAKDIVERHGGSIALVNRPEGGAMLTVRLPTTRQVRP